MYFHCYYSFYKLLVYMTIMSEIYSKYIISNSGNIFQSIFRLFQNQFKKERNQEFKILFLACLFGFNYTIVVFNSFPHDYRLHTRSQWQYFWYYYYSLHTYWYIYYAIPIQKIHNYSILTLPQPLYFYMGTKTIGFTYTLHYIVVVLVLITLYQYQYYYYSSSVR